MPLARIKLSESLSFSETWRAFTSYSKAEKAEENVRARGAGWRCIGERVKSQSDVKRRRIASVARLVYTSLTSVLARLPDDSPGIQGEGGRDRGNT